MSAYASLKTQLEAQPKTWLITGVAGFIGSNLLETLLKLHQRVVGLDNFSTGYPHNLEEVEALVSPEQWGRFQFIQGDIRELRDCQRAMTFCPVGTSSSPVPVDYVLHQAALGSVPRSIEDPILAHQNNLSGFLNILVAARDAKVSRLVYAASSSTYGDHPELPKVEPNIGNPLSPYAVTKLANELYADVFARCYGLPSAGLRYFNIFGRRQDPEGAYAAVIPKWISAMMQGEPLYINGDGETSRDFCYIDNAVQANLLAATAQRTLHLPDDGASFSSPQGKGGRGEGKPEGGTCEVDKHQVYNIAVGDRTSLNQLFEAIRSHLLDAYPHLKEFHPTYREFRPGDVRHSLADITKARSLLGYQPSHRISEGLKEAMEWYVARGGG